MADSYKDKFRNKLKRKYHDFDKRVDAIYALIKKVYPKLDTWKGIHKAMKLAGGSPYENLSVADNKRIVNYSRNPSWYNRLTFHKPSRVRERVKLTQVDLNNCEDFNDAELWLDTKPMEYYW